MIITIVNDGYTGSVDIIPDDEACFTLISATRIVMNSWNGCVPLQKNLHYAWLKEIEEVENRPIFSEKTKQIAKRNGTVSFLEAMKNDILDLCSENYDFQLKFKYKPFVGDIIEIEEE